MVSRLRADASARKTDLFLREVASKIRAATAAAAEARTRYDLMGNLDIAALLRARHELHSWTVRRQVLVECWELASGAIWDSGMQKQ